MNQAETERVEAQNRKLLAENQKVKIYLRNSIQLVFVSDQRKDRDHEKGIKCHGENAWGEEKLD